jgi:hypothetical protein
MTTLQGSIYAVAAADATLLALLGAGTASVGLPCLLGSDTTTKPPAPAAPWAMLTLQGDVPSLALNAVDGGFRWWLYDLEQFGYTRLNAVAGRLLGLYVETTGFLYRDTTTLEKIWWQGPGTVGPQLAAEEYGQLLRWVDVPYRKTHRGITLAA